MCTVLILLRLHLLLSMVVELVRWHSLVGLLLVLLGLLHHLRIITLITIGTGGSCSYHVTLLLKV